RVGRANAVNNGSNFFKKSLVGLVALTLTLSFLTGHLLGGKARAQQIAGHLLGDNFAESPIGGRKHLPRHKIAPDLDTNIEISAKKNSSEELQRVIIQLSDSAPDINEFEGRGTVAGKLSVSGGMLRKSFRSMGMVSAELPLSRIRDLENDPEIEYI